MPVEYDRHGNPVSDDPVEYDRNGRPIAPARARGSSGTWQEEVGGALANINRGIPFAQDLVNFAGGVRGALDGRGFQEGMEAQRGDSQALQQQFRQRRPNAAAFSEGVGNVAPMAFTAGAAGAPTVATRGVAALPMRGPMTIPAARTQGPALFLGQTRDAAGIGYATGALYGGSTGDAPNMDAGDRVQAANQAGQMGAIFGAATPAVANTVAGAAGLLSPMFSALDRRVNLSASANSGLGAMGGQMFQGGRNPPGRPQPPATRIPRAAMGTIDRLASRNRMTPDQVEVAFNEALRNPQGQVTADLFGDTGVRVTRALAQGPGQTGGRAAEVARARSQDAPDRILNELNRRMAVAETPEQAMQSLNKQYDEVSATLYEPLFQRTMAPEMRATVNEFLRRHSDDPVFEDAIRRARSIFARDLNSGALHGNYALTDNFSRFLHYVKMGLDDAVSAARRNPTGAQATELRGINEMRRRFITALDNAVPGYKQARNRWSSLSSAEEALDEGRTLLNQRSGFVRQRMAEMTDFERYHARVGFANEIANRVGLRGSVNGNRNVAEALGSPEMQRRVAAMFDSPEEAAAFLDTLNQQNMLMRNAGQWGTGSQTASNLLHSMDEGLNTATDMAVQAGTGNVAGAARRGVQGAANFLTGGQIERANDQRGGALLQRIGVPEDSPSRADAESFARAVVEELRRRAAARNNATVASQAGAAASGSQQGRDRR